MAITLFIVFLTYGLVSLLALFTTLGFLTLVAIGLFAAFGLIGLWCAHCWLTDSTTKLLIVPSQQEQPPQ